ncbi:hypothetical protein [Variovorax sp. YR216]|uniref:hypothetical protein n=1 Tax=Variovorax sp. YR216 TaxID=1882828 RepID=UPI00089AE9E8|nr:hypothetical protein [Variovorax sp. YR216]SEA38208.1 hypothetical protein SAMN05444680_102187 [Variovorax sp. YR216]
MINPWLTKNPFMSMWLTAANQIMGTTQSLVAAEFQRQAAAMQAEFERQVVEFWTGAWMGASVNPRHKR